MKLSKIIEGLNAQVIKGNTDIDIKGIAFDSRNAKQDTLFVCIEGTVSDGHNYISGALEKGACALLVQKEVKVPEHITVIRMKDTRYGLSYISDSFFGHPSQKIRLAGITGTKGKTTTTYMIKSILEKSGEKVGLIGTVEKLIGKEAIFMDRTTPESYDLQYLFHEMLVKKVDTAVMEVSSQGLKLHRVSCTDFDIGIFTNISRAHIGPREHSSFEDYLESKQKLFSMCRIGLINRDSDYSQNIIDNARCEVLTYGIENKSDIMASNIEKHSDSVEFDFYSPWYQGRLKVGVPGIFSVYNALAAAGTCGIKGIEFEHVKKGLEKVDVKGRVEIVETPGKDFTVIIDYAHSPDSLKNILQTVKDFAKGRVICLFGCGGDRDSMMRPMMGEISGNLADYTIITSDNPRTEEPEAIVRGIEEGIKKTNGEYITIVDRTEAIKYALDTGKKDDVIILAGKGHETYQTFKDKTIHFDEREIVSELIKVNK